MAAVRPSIVLRRNWTVMRPNPAGTMTGGSCLGDAEEQGGVSIQPDGDERPAGDHQEEADQRGEEVRESAEPEPRTRTEETGSGRRCGNACSERVARYAPKKPTQITSCRAATSPQDDTGMECAPEEHLEHGQPQHERRRRR